jgi:hypothetical protein
VLGNDLSDFWAHQFFRRQASTLKYSPNPSAAEFDTFPFAMRTGLLMGDPSAFSAIEEGLKEQWAYA